MTGLFGKQTVATLPIGFRLLRTALKLSALVSTEFAGRWANKLWFRSRRYPQPAREQEWLASAQSQRLMHRDQPLAVQHWGTGPTVILVHGWHGRGAQLGAFAAPLVAAGVRVVAFDAPAHGLTPGHSTDLPEVSAALLTVAQAFPPLHGVIAHSFGTAVTLYAITQGLAPRRVVALSAPSNLEYLMESFGARLDLPAGVVAVHRRLLEERFGTDIWKRFSPREIARHLDIPALLVHDQEDHDVPYREGMALAQAWPGATHVQTQGLGHRRILRDPQVVARVVAFMAESSTHA